MTQVEKHILRSLVGGKQSIWQVLRENRGYLAQITGALSRLLAQELIASREEILYLTEKGQALAKKMGLIPRQEIRCPTCQGRGIVARGLFARVRTQFETLAENRPRPRAEYDQGFVTPEVTVARVMLMYLRGDLENQDLLLIGDDDLTSIAAALTGLPRRIQVLEIDAGLVEFISETARKMHWNHLHVQTYDVCRPLPRDLVGAFTTACTDPVETLPGITLFLSRCAEALQGPDAALYFGLTTLEASPQKRYQIQKLLLEMGFVITDISPGFHTYLLSWEESITKNFPLLRTGPFALNPPDAPWYTSALIRGEVVSGPYPKETGGATLDRTFYFDEEA
jgi:predicted methyltransferase